MIKTVCAHVKDENSCNLYPFTGEPICPYHGTKNYYYCPNYKAEKLETPIVNEKDLLVVEDEITEHSVCKECMYLKYYEKENEYKCIIGFKPPIESKCMYYFSRESWTQ